MCGIVGLFLKDKSLELTLGEMLTQMLITMSDRGPDPAGITTQDPQLSARLDPILAGQRLKNYLKVMTLEAQTIARACGKNHILNLEPEDLCALTVEAAAMAQVPLSGTNWIPGKPDV